jgi:Glycosyltransferase family 87
MPPEKIIPYKFIVLASLILLADFIIENINHKFQLNDFKVYYNAATAFITGKQVYGVLFSLGSGYYKYSPFTALLFYPLGLLPYYIACVIEFALTSLAIVLTGVLLFKIYSAYFPEPVKSANLLLSFSLICVATHFVRDLELGNVNAIMLMILCLILLFIIRGKFFFAGFLLAMIIITKPFFILLIIPLVVRQHYKTLFTTTIVLAFCFILPALVSGITRDLDLHKQWLNAILIHAGNFASPNTIDAVIRNNIFPSLPSYFQYILILLLLIPYLLFIRSNIAKTANNGKFKLTGVIMEWFTLIAIIPSIFKTDTEHFLMTLPIIVYILIYLFNSRNIATTALFIMLIIMYAGNSSDWLGRGLSEKIQNWGILGVGNILILALAFYCYFRQNKKILVIENKQFN